MTLESLLTVFVSGHPFVILEDKKNHRHMVPAPDPSDTSDVSSNDRLPNGTGIGKVILLHFVVLYTRINQCKAAFSMA